MRRFLTGTMLLTAMWLTAPLAAQELLVGGTGAALGAMQRLATAFAAAHSDTVPVVLPSMGSSGGIKAVLAGAIAVAVSGRPPKPAETAAGATAVPLGRTPFVIAVNPTVPVEALTSRELADLFSGRTGRWPDGTPARPVLRPQGDSDMVSLQEMGPEMASALEQAARRGGLHIAMTDQECADHIASIPGAFGSSTLSLIVAEGRPIRPMTLDGRAPTVSALAAGTYPYVRELWLVTGPSADAGAAAFVAFAHSTTGRAVLADAGILAR
ncbi:MAG: substrate-binding domain-containing protein [Ectothiorhodospiraceae bacterium]|nr:substrate-binding domain-containing protein [Chromatiales bacterium]MCP5154854.1 substrate-binding domain-containing protein [Ectothiorhodospiraceae bacterium]